MLTSPDMARGDVLHLKHVQPAPRWFHFHLVYDGDVVGSGNIRALDEARAVSSATLTLAGLNEVVLIADGACDE